MNKWNGHDYIAGATIPVGGTARENKTGSWRGSDCPHFDRLLCIDCLLCWVSCPDSCILLMANDEITGIDLDYCKGCGICAAVCPRKAITMGKKKDNS